MRAIRILVAVTVLAASAWTIDLWHDHASAEMVLKAVTTTGHESYNPGTWKDTTFVLVVGSDERAGLEGARGDALHVVGLNPSAGKATILDIPRDSWVDIPGHGVGRINEAYGMGGADLQAQTVRNLTGAPIKYVLQTTFGGLITLVDKLGGVDVNVPYPMNDTNSGAVFNPGPQHLNGVQSLAFSRNRHIPDGDLQRTLHQGDLIIGGLAKLRSNGTSPTDVLHYLDVLFRTVRTTGINSTDLFRLGRAALAIDPANVRNVVMPANIGMHGKLSVVFVRQPDAGSLFADFSDDGVLESH